MRGGSETGSYSRRIDLYHSTLCLRVIKKKKINTFVAMRRGAVSSQRLFFKGVLASKKYYTNALLLLIG